ncbi:MAG: AzlC family ABC transporter permease [Acinetobacter sp.]
MNIRNFIDVFKLSLPIATAYIPLGIALGIYVVSSGLDWYIAPLAALIIFAGSIEFLVVSFILSGLPLFTVAWTAFVVNFRHIFYGLSFPINTLQRPWQRIYGVFALTDEIYAITCVSKNRLDGDSITLLQIMSQLWWVSATLIGALLGAIIPSSIKGFEFALTAMFLTMAMDATRHSRENKLIVYALISGGLGWCAETYLIQSSFLVVGLLSYLVFITLDYKKMQNMEVNHV